MCTLARSHFVSINDTLIVSIETPSSGRELWRGAGGTRNGRRRNDNNYTGKLWLNDVATTQAGVQLDTLCFTFGRQVSFRVNEEYFMASSYMVQRNEMSGTLLSSVRTSESLDGAADAVLIEILKM